MQAILSFLIEHWLLCSIFFIVLLAVMGVEIVLFTKSVSKLTVPDAVRWMNETQAKTIDMRPKEAYQRGHILGAVSAPFSSMKKDLQSLETYKNQPILLVCESGVTAELLANRLTKNGYTQVRVLNGGMKAWVQAGMPLEG